MEGVDLIFLLCLTFHLSLFIIKTNLMLWRVRLLW